MNDTEIIKAVAELDGWNTEKITIGGVYAYRDKLGHIQASLPSYLTSRDAIVPVIEKQALACQIVMSRIIRDMHVSWSVLATPRQLCEALLRATGKWKEE